MLQWLSSLTLFKLKDNWDWVAIDLSYFKLHSSSVKLILNVPGGCVTNLISFENDSFSKQFFFSRKLFTFPFQKVVAMFLNK